MTVTPRTSTNCTRHSDTTPSHTVPALRAFTAARRRSPAGSPASAIPVHYPGAEDIATTNGTIPVVPDTCPIRRSEAGTLGHSWDLRQTDDLHQRCSCTV